jgi:hypothetical protein
MGGSREDHDVTGVEAVSGVTNLIRWIDARKFTWQPKRQRRGRRMSDDIYPAA